MSANWTRGTSYAVSGTVNETNIAALIESATQAGVDRSNCVSGSRPITSVSSAPSDLGTLEPWCHPDQLWPITKIEDGTVASLMPYAVRLKLDSGSASVSACDLVQPLTWANGYPTVTKAKVAEPWKVFAVAAQSAAAGADFIGILHGLVRVRVSDTVVPGEMLRVSTTTDGRAERVGAAGSGSGIYGFAVATSTATAGGIVWALKRR